MEATLNRPQNLAAKMVSSKLFWVLACGFFFAFPLLKSVQRQLPTKLPVYGVVPYYSFTDELGNSFGTGNLKGRMYVANFMFTSCQTMCPTLMKQVQTVQHRLRGVLDRAAIVSFTVDPETDTPEVLYSKARELNANPAVWKFLTAPMDETKKLLVDGFKVPVGEKEIAESVMDVGHSNKFVLVDQSGQIRGYYNSDKEGINRMMIDAGLIINENKSFN